MSLSKICSWQNDDACKAVIACLPCDYGYVLLTGLGSVVLNFYLAQRVLSARKKYGVQFPTLYSETEQTFNCIQRSHQNYLENQPQFIFLLLAGGLAHPHAATVAGCVYLGGRILYHHGYATGDPNKRMRGAPFQALSFFTLIGCTVSLAYANIKHFNGGKLIPALK